MIFFISDTHFSHKNISIKRGFSCVEEMNEKIIKNWNSVISTNDIVYHLGDFSLSNKMQEIEAIFKRLNGKIVLIRGNHDSNKMINKIDFHDVFDKLEIKINGFEITLSHFSYLIWNKSHYGTFHFHGHSHGNLVHPNKRAIDISVECWDYKPITFERIYEEKMKCLI